MKEILCIKGVIAVLFLICYAHQFFYIVYALFRRPRTFLPTAQTNRYAVLICARNEAAVLGFLLDSIRKQTYPPSQVEVYVCADQCTDETAAVAKRWGARVLERFHPRQVGKGYALDALVQYVYGQRGMDFYDGFFIVDADNLLDADFIAEMDKCFCAGARIVTGYRNAKNFGENGIASG